MYKYKIVVDSSSNLPADYIKDPEVGFEIIPLTIRIDGTDYKDVPGADVKAMLEAFHKAKTKPTTSCPSPLDYEESYKDAENVIAITISSKLSGSFNSAYVGSLNLDDTRVHVVDSKATAGNMMLLVDKAYELIKKGETMEKIEEEIDAYVERLNLVFLLDSFETLVKAGRINKAVAFVASSLNIKAICEASNGQIKLTKQVRSMKKALLTLPAVIKSKVDDPSKHTLVISYVEDDTVAQKLKTIIEEACPFKEIRLVKDTLLCSFYALEGGIILSF